MTVPPELRPSALGTLSKTPLSHLIVFVAEKRLDGTLVLRGSDRSESVVVFSQGSPGKVKTTYVSAPLGRVLLQLEMVDAASLESASEACAHNDEPLGEYLLSLGKIDRAQLVAALREQVMRRMVRIFEQIGDDTSYEFYANVNLLQDGRDLATTPIDSFHVLWEGINARPNDPRIEPTLGRLSTAALRLNPDADLLRFGFGAPEMMLIDLLRARPVALDDLIAQAVLPVRQTKMLVYALLITKSLSIASSMSITPPPVRAVRMPTPNPEATPTGTKSQPSTRLSSAPGSSLFAMARSRSAPGISGPWRGPGNESAMREEVKARAEKIDQEDLFVVLGVSETATPDIVQAAYFSLAKKWHPDRIPSALAELRDDASRVFARISEAHATLTDPERRQRYLELRKSTGGGAGDEQSKVQRILDAAMDFQKAEVFAKKRDWEKAEHFARRSMDGDSEQMSYAALYGWTLANRPDRLAKKDFAEPLELLNAAIAKEPNSERARFYRATLLKMLGMDQQAMADFRRCAELNPRNIDASREVRLWEMRGTARRSLAPPPTQETSSASPPGTSTAASKPIDWRNADVRDMLGHLFKKK